MLLLYTVWVSVHGLFQHCNVRLRLGPLNYIFSMCELHRWHHSLKLEEANSNYGNNILFWDLVFDTNLKGPFFLAQSIAREMISWMLGSHSSFSRGSMSATDIALTLGIGNATGLGMAPFVVSHPELLHQWFAARETAISRVRSLLDIPPQKIARAVALQKRASLLDSITAEMKRLQTGLGTADRARVSEYLDSIREVERRIETTGFLDLKCMEPASPPHGPCQ